MEEKKSDSELEQEMIMLLHDMSLSKDGGKAIGGRLCKEHMPLYMRFMDIALKNGTDRFDLVTGVTTMMVGMSVMLLYGYNKEQRDKATEGIIIIFSEKFRALSAAEDFPKSSDDR
jgi:hypothetical protein